MKKHNSFKRRRKLNTKRESDDGVMNCFKWLGEEMAKLIPRDICGIQLTKDSFGGFYDETPDTTSEDKMKEIKKLFDELEESKKQNDKEKIVLGVTPDNCAHDIFLVDKDISIRFLQHINQIKNLLKEEKTPIVDRYVEWIPDAASNNDNKMFIPMVFTYPYGIKDGIKDRLDYLKKFKDLGI